MPSLTRSKLTCAILPLAGAAELPKTSANPVFGPLGTADVEHIDYNFLLRVRSTPSMTELVAHPKEKAPGIAATLFPIVGTAP
jgi:hypothetical protein